METESCNRAQKALRKEDRRRAILDIAERSFFDRGFAETSMSAIAAECGGSKTTLWSHFPSKEALFNAVLDQQIGLFEESLRQALDPDNDLRTALGRFSRVFLTKILAPKSRALKRILAAEGQRFPALAEAFYERGPARVRRRLTRYMEEEMALGQLREGSPELAARQLLALCQAGCFADLTWHAVVAEPSVDADADQAVDAFLRIWSPGA